MSRTILLSQFSLRKIQLANRIVVSPMGQYSADEEGFATQWHLMHLGNLAISGAGLVFTEATAVEPRGRVSNQCLGIWDDRHVDALTETIAFCRLHGGAKLGMQLAHAGRKGSVTVPWKKQLAMDEGTGGWTMPSSSALAYPGRPEPEALDQLGINTVAAAFASAALRADKAGFDVIEIHNAHGYLLHSFLSPLANTRSDLYGGSLQNRMRFPLEVFDAVRRVWPEDKALGVRISATDWAEGGWTIEDSIVFARALKVAGCDYVCASSGGTTPAQKIELIPGYQVPLAEALKREVDMPIMAVGLITEPQQAEDILSKGQADMIALGRGMLYDPRWPWHAAEYFGEEIYFPPQYERAHPSMRRGDFLKPFREKATT
jgi:2,4-dienoyl-CoA reductase-like NADH-dependent reductase (Old Yellow Enzyme family)